MQWNVEEGHNQPRYWSGVDKIQRLLRRVVRSDPLIANYVAISGSAALFWYQHRFDIGPKWKEMPHDIDVFVCGNNGRHFEIFMIHMEEEIIYNATTHGLRLNQQNIKRSEKTALSISEVTSIIDKADQSIGTTETITQQDNPVL